MSKTFLSTLRGGVGPTVFSSSALSLFSCRRAATARCCPWELKDAQVLPAGLGAARLAAQHRAGLGQLPRTVLERQQGAGIPSHLNSA